MRQQPNNTQKQKMTFRGLDNQLVHVVCLSFFLIYWIVLFKLDRKFNYYLYNADNQYLTFWSSNFNLLMSKDVKNLTI